MNTETNNYRRVLRENWSSRTPSSSCSNDAYDVPHLPHTVQIFHFIPTRIPIEWTRQRGPGVHRGRRATDWPTQLRREGASAFPECHELHLDWIDFVSGTSGKIVGTSVRKSLLVVMCSHNLVFPSTLNPWLFFPITTEDAVRFATASECFCESKRCIWNSVYHQVSKNFLGQTKTMLHRTQAPTRRMLVDPKGLGKPPLFSGREKQHFHVWTKKIENYVSGVFPNVREALTFAAESQDVVTAATVAIGVPELGVETSAEIGVQLFVVLSALTEGEGFDVVMSAGGHQSFESWCKLHGRWNPYTVGRARNLLREIWSPTRAK